MAGPLSTSSVYARLARTRDVPRLALAGLATGLAGTSIPVALLLFAREATGSLATASLLLAAGADPETANESGVTPRALAERVGLKGI